MNLAIRNTLLGGTDITYGEKPIASSAWNDTFNEVQRQIANTSTGHDHDGTDSKALAGVWRADETYATQVQTTSASYVTLWTYSMTCKGAKNMPKEIRLAFDLNSSDNVSTATARFLLTDADDNVLYTSSEVTETSSADQAKVIAAVFDSDGVGILTGNETGYKIKVQAKNGGGANSRINDQVLIFMIFDQMQAITMTQA